MNKGIIQEFLIGIAACRDNASLAAETERIARAIVNDGRKRSIRDQCLIAEGLVLIIQQFQELPEASRKAKAILTPKLGLDLSSTAVTECLFGKDRE